MRAATHGALFDYLSSSMRAPVPAVLVLLGGCLAAVLRCASASSVPLHHRHLLQPNATSTSTASGSRQAGADTRLLSSLRPPLLEPSDLVATVVTDFSRLALARGGRAWRKGLAAYVAVAEPGMPIPLEQQLEASGVPFNETWGAWPYKSLFPETAGARVSNLPRQRLAAGRTTAQQQDTHNQRQQRHLSWSLWGSSSSRDAQQQGAPPVEYINSEQAAALAILAAHKAHTAEAAAGAAAPAGAGYKWMLVGPPETLFYTDNVRAVLPAFDHSLPYAISDSFVYGGDGAPSKLFPRCLPCHYRDEALLMAMYNGREGAYASGSPEIGCPCSQASACTSHRHGRWDPHLQSAADAGPRRQKACESDPSQPGCTVQRDCQAAGPWQQQAGAEGEQQRRLQALPYAADLGSGFILSRALLDLISSNATTESAFVGCVGRLAPVCRGPGCSFTQCLISQLDVAFTDPGPGLLHGDRGWMLFNNGEQHRCLAGALRQLVDGAADDHCRWLMRNAMSLRIPKPAPPPVEPQAAGADGSAPRSRRRRPELGQEQEEWAEAVRTATAMHKGALAWLLSEDYARLS